MRRAVAIWIACAWFMALGVVTGQAASTISGLKVSHNQLLDASGHEVHLTGVNRSGTEYACVQGWGIFDGPSDDASIAVIAAWGANAVRIGINEDCWLGINSVSQQYAGPVYQLAIVSFVNRLHAHGLYAVVSLMWAAPGDNRATWQEAIADEDHAIAFWSSVANRFRDDRATIFDLYGEPSSISWSCWVDGCSYTDKYGTWQTAGMRQMLQTVRQAGAHNVLLMAGIDYANDLSNWLAYAPEDPDHQLGASFHLFGDNTCRTSECWDPSVRQVAMRVPVVTAELGESASGTNCGHAFVDSYVSYARSNGISYLAWVWDAWKSCSALIVDYRGTPTLFGAAYRGDLASGPSYSSLPYLGSRPTRPLVDLPVLSRRTKYALVAIAFALVAAVAVGGWMMFVRARTAR